jgi:hypothetical protein
VRRNANVAVVMAAIAFLAITLTAPLAVYYGHKALRSIKRDRVGLQHRGAALVGVVFGWFLVAVLLLADIPMTVKAALELSRGL